ncbi:hypothetical protein PVA45_05195 [Entomospira entomophila]|uniref:Nucleotide modification associated domain-containing protein n=1 Tax=Entomospira entomophila TaxID=2719988 RepID=A0A968GEB7_9SPIO|nr:hypothetical protein [Entomospira entomophilus]NIZ40894.1 hypothetical protein [Entomospira entomophilus]WDI35107.1 hypothetical protein PVA45_05195 [Entomospira entomophilus]
MAFQVNQIYSYIVAEDNGYSPNPFWGVLTLPWCKPPLRRAVAKFIANANNISDVPSLGIWLVGLSRKQKDGSNHMIFVAQITEVLSHHDYFVTYPQKHPKMDPSLPYIHHVGDNCYYMDNNSSSYATIPSVHSHDPVMQQRDLSVPSVLISNNFCYYGSNSSPLPSDLMELKVGQGFKSTFSSETNNLLYDYLQTIQGDCYPSGRILGSPAVWPAHDTSWQQSI